MKNLSQELKRKRDAEARLRQTDPAKSVIYSGDGSTGAGGGGYVVPADLLNETAHDALDHTGLTGIMDETAHDALDHTGLTGVGDISPLTTKGDIYTYAADNARLAVGTDGQVLTADAASTNGIKWAAGPAAANGVVGGGTAGQIYAKIDGTDYNAEWVDNSGESLLVASAVVSGSAVTSVQFTGLDLNTDKDWVLVSIIINATASAADVRLFVNGDTTATNYRASAHWFYSGGHDKASVDGPTFANVLASKHLYSVCNISIANGYPSFLSRTIKGGDASAVAQDWGGYKEDTEANVTQLDITSTVASSIAVGSEFRLYRRG